MVKCTFKYTVKSAYIFKNIYKFISNSIESYLSKLKIKHVQGEKEHS